jgi:hypothetical protein
MHCNIYDVFYSKCSHQRVSAGIPAIFRVMLLQDYKRTNVVNRGTITPKQLKLYFQLKLSKNYKYSLKMDNH